MHIHILGICGTFMGGIAAIAKQSGHKVTGCDQNIYPPMSTQLEQLGIELYQGFDHQQISEFNPDAFVVGNIMTRGMPVVERLLREKRNMISGPQWLYENLLCQQDHIIGIAGTHGKTTTSSMVAWILEDNDKNPGFLIGGIPSNFDVSARLGDGSVFVIEADEYDTAFFDKRSKFIHYHPDILILNNLEFDHADIFESLVDIEHQFHHLVKIVPDNGHIISNSDDENLASVLNKGCWSNVDGFGKKPSTWQMTSSDSHLFNISHRGQSYLTESVLPGQHNQLNQLAAIIACHKIGISVEKAIDSAKKFKPPKRRLELKFENDVVSVYDDFAHHPTAIEETIKAIKSEKNLVVVFEPRSNSMRSGAHSEGLKIAFNNADHIIFYQPENSDIDFTFLKLEYTERLQIYNNIDKIIEHLSHSLVKNTNVVFMSNGGFENIINKFINTLAN